jgi:hypothetical protein
LQVSGFIIIKARFCTEVRFQMVCFLRMLIAF